MAILGAVRPAGVYRWPAHADMAASLMPSSSEYAEQARHDARMAEREELSRLRAENERLRADVAWRDRQLAGADAENERLRRELNGVQSVAKLNEEHAMDSGRGEAQDGPGTPAGEPSSLDRAVRDV